MSNLISGQDARRRPVYIGLARRLKESSKARTLKLGVGFRIEFQSHKSL